MKDNFLENFNGSMIITGDLHLHNFTSYSDKNPDINSRLLSTLSVLDQILQHAIANKIYCIVLNGDIFETKSEVQCIVNNQFFDWCVECKNAGISIIMVAGNHDIASLTDERITLLHPYKALDNVEVIDDYTIFDYSYFKGFCNCVFLPFRRDIKTTRAWAKNSKKEINGNPEMYKGNNDPMNLLFAHCSILGAKITNREFLDTKNAIYIQELVQDFYDYVFLSHFHTRQNVAERAKYVGSPLHHDMSDIGDDRGFYHLDCSTAKLTFIKTVYPTFNRIVLESRADLDKVLSLDNNNYYEIKILTGEISESDLSGFKRNHKIKLVYDVALKIQTRIENISTKTDIQDIIRDFIKLNNPDRLNNTELLLLGMEYIKASKGV